MNILLLANHCNTGGITSYVLGLTRGLTQKGHKVFVVSSGGNCREFLRSAGAEHVDMNIKVKSEAHPQLWLALPGLMRLIKEKNIDIVHAQTRTTQVLAAAAARLTGTPNLSTCHGFFKPRAFRRLFPGWGQGVIAISKSVRRHLVEDFKVEPHRVALIPNGIDLKQFKPTDEKERELKRQQWNVDGTPVLGCIARLSSVKGLDVLIAAVPEIQRYFPRTRVWLVGDGPEKVPLQQLVEQQGLSTAVRFESIVNRTSDLLPIFDLFVMPSLQEGLGISVMEAQAAGIPVVASNVGGLPDLIQDGVTGALVPANNSAALARKIIELLKNPKQARVLASTARREAEDKFSLDKMVSATIYFYEQHTGR